MRKHPPDTCVTHRPIGVACSTAKDKSLAPPNVCVEKLKLAKPKRFNMRSARVWNLVAANGFKGSCARGTVALKKHDAGLEYAIRLPM